ncbi:MAG TPA: hypothetical protein VL614_01750 [Acetobacteraceae bacterium]|jgi:hypothetical protein|nr:hypothetical protein [Acetobacteraceae bacterium]
MRACRIELVIGASLAVMLAAPAAAMDSCNGQYSAAALSPLPSPTVISLDLSGSTITAPALVQAFTQGLKDAGQQVGTPSNAVLTLSWNVLGQGGASGTGGGNGSGSPYAGDNATGWSNWSGSNAAWLQGGETAALPGIPSYTMFSPKPAVQSALLVMRAQVRPAGAAVAAWIATLQCTIQPVDNSKLAYELGRRLGSVIGREVNQSPL